LSAREVSQLGIPGNAGWQQQHLIYTHGYGAVASKVNTATPSGLPDFVLKDIPPQNPAIPLDPGTGGQVYYGELSDVPYVVVNTKQKELNYPNPNGTSTFTSYEGKGGIEIGGFFRRAVFAYRYRDFNLLISGLINPDSKILINRDIRSRIQKAAPFLQYDADPYSAIVNGQVYYIWDAYTSTDLYPYSQRRSLSEITNRDMSGSVNYIRNSVKAVMNAYDGTVRFYVVDPTDPLIKVWERAFPSLFTDGSKAPPGLQAHFRYPEDLLQIQAAQFARYHVTDAPTFFNNAERWAVPGALPTGPNQPAPDGTLRPYYVILKLPGESQEQFVLFEPFTPFGRENQMIGYIAAGSDPGQYGRLTSFQFPPGQNLDGPTQVRSLVNQDPNVSPQISLLSQKGSDVLFGDLIIVPIDQGFLYVQPVFVVSAGNPIPELKRVVVVHGGNATIAATLTEALAASFGQQVPTTPTPPSGPAPTGRVAQLLAQALQHFQKADQALKKGDLAGYQREIQAGEALVRQANQASAATPSPSPSPSPSPTPSG
ncbi:MAG TPA: UPF0182 family protein, partial [Actinomycetota bacterium]|nr:UPF0182 family protein [Actinomycetota bacterium]